MTAPASDPSPRTCAVHGAEPAVTACALCGRGLCGPCYRFEVGARPACVLCAREIGTRRQRRVSLAVVVALVGIAAGVVGGVRAGGEPLVITGSVVLAVFSMGLGLYIGQTGRIGDAALEVRERDPGEEPVLVTSPGAGHPYRAAARRVVAAAAPRLSGGATAAVVAAALLFASLAVPSALHLPRWLETEALLLVVYVGVAAALALLLYRGYRVEDDHRFLAPTPPWRGVGETSARPAPWRPPLFERGKGQRRCGVGDGCDLGCSGAEGCAEGCAGCGDAMEALPLVGALILVVLAAILAGVGVVFFSWLLVEVALPLLFLAFYEMLIFVLRRVARDRHGCEGRALRSVAYGMLWSAVGVTPLAVATYALHLFVQRSAS